MSGKRIIDGLNEYLSGAPHKVIGLDPARPGSEKTEYQIYLGDGVFWKINERTYQRLLRQKRRRETRLRVIQGGR